MSAMEIIDSNPYPAIRNITGYGDKLKFLTLIATDLLQRVALSEDTTQYHMDMKDLSAIRSIPNFVFGLTLSPDAFKKEISVNIRASWSNSMLSVLVTRYLPETSHMKKGYNTNGGNEILVGVWEADATGDSWGIRAAYETGITHEFAMKTMGFIFGKAAHEAGILKEEDK